MALWNMMSYIRCVCLSDCKLLQL